MKSTFYTHLIKTTIAHLLLQTGFTRATTQSLSILSDILIHYFKFLLNKKTFFNDNTFLINKRTHILKKLLLIQLKNKQELLSYIHSIKKIKNSTFNIEIVNENKKEEFNEDNRVIRRKEVIENKLVEFIKMCTGKEEKEDLKEIKEGKEGEIQDSKENDSKDSHSKENDSNPLHFNSLPFKISKGPNRLKINKKEFTEMVNFRKSKEDDLKLITDELMFYCKRVVEKE